MGYMIPIMNATKNSSGGNAPMPKGCWIIWLAVMLPLCGLLVYSLLFIPQ